MIGILGEVLAGSVEVVIPRTVIAQVWRGTPGQASVNRLINAARLRAGPVVVDELTADRAKQIGVAIGRTHHSDVIHVHVAIAATDAGTRSSRRTTPTSLRSTPAWCSCMCDTGAVSP